MSDPVLDPTALDPTNAARETMAMLVMNSNNKGGGGVDDLFISSSTWHHAHTCQPQDACTAAAARNLQWPGSRELEPGPHGLQAPVAPRTQHGTYWPRRCCRRSRGPLPDAWADVSGDPSSTFC